MYKILNIVIVIFKRASELIWYLAFFGWAEERELGNTALV